MTYLRGYSLLELVVTLVIAGILAAVAIPYFNQSEIDAAWFYEQAKSAARYAQRQAVAQRRNVHVIVRSTRVELCYAPADLSGACPAGSEVPQITTGSPYAIDAPDGVTLAPTSFSFDGLGRPNPSGGASFNVAGRAIVVTAETGYVQ